MKAKKPVVTKVRGIEVSKVDPVRLTAYLTEQKITFAPNDAAALKLERYLDWSQIRIEAAGEGDYGECEVCKSPVDPDLSVCPVCGDGAQNEVKDGGEPDGEDGAGDPAGESIETSGETLATVADLDQAINDYKQAVADGAISYWQMGKKLLVIYERKLYKARRGDDGSTPRYKSWNEFAEAELDVTGRHAARIMDVARLFSEAQVRKFGVAKLALLVKVEEPERPKLLAAAETLTARQLETKVKSIGASDSDVRSGNRSDAQEAVRKRATDAAKTARDNKAAARKVDAEKGAVTAVFQMGSNELIVSGDATDAVVKALGRGKLTTEESLVNGVRVVYTIKVSGKKLILQVKREREKPKAAE